MAKKLYSPTATGGIKFVPNRKPGEVRIPNYVYDLWLPLLGADAIAVYAVYCRLERAEIVKAITLETIAKCCRMSKTTISTINKTLEDCGFITIKRPTGNARANHMTNEITVNDPPTEITAEQIQEYKPKGDYEPLSKWLCEVPSSTPHEVPDSTSRSTGQYHEEVPDSTPILLQPSVLQPLDVEEKNAPNGAISPSKQKKTSPNKYASEDTLITSWAAARKLKALDIGANVCTDSARKKAAEMLKWPIPATVEEIRECTIEGIKRKADYPFEFIPGDLINLRARKAKGSKPTGVWAETTPPELPDPGLTKEERIALVEKTRSERIAS